MHRWANAFSNHANFVIFNSREPEIGEKSRGVIAVILLSYMIFVSTFSCQVAHRQSRGVLLQRLPLLYYEGISFGDNLVLRSKVGDTDCEICTSNSYCIAL